jgi:hypothetical protein
MFNQFSNDITIIALVRAGHTGMEAVKLVENIVEIANNAVPKLPRKWANVQVVSIKIPESVALPVYNKTPQILKELAQLDGTEEVIVENKKEEKKQTKTEDKGSRKSKSKSPLLQALKKVEDEEKKQTKKKIKEVDAKTKQRSKRKPAASATKQDSVEKKEGQKKKKQRSLSVDGSVVKASKKLDSEGTKAFVGSKKFKGSKKGYVFRAGIQGVGYYIDVKPVVDRMALQALLRISKSSNNKGNRNKKNSKRRSH